MTTYTITDYTGDEIKFNSLQEAYHYIKIDIADLLKADYCPEDMEIDMDRIYADLREFYHSSFDPQKIPWIKEGDCWLSDLYSVYQEKQIL